MVRWAQNRQCAPQFTTWKLIGTTCGKYHFCTERERSESTLGKIIDANIPRYNIVFIKKILVYLQCPHTLYMLMGRYSCVNATPPLAWPSSYSHDHWSRRPSLLFVTKYILAWASHAWPILCRDITYYYVDRENVRKGKDWVWETLAMIIWPS